MRALVLLIVCSGAAAPQVLVDLSKPEGRELIDRFETAWTKPSGEPLDCDVRQLSPSLTFSFRHQTGFFLSLPLHQMDPQGSQVSMTTSVRPLAGGNPYYFWQGFTVPKFPAEKIGKRVVGEVGGGFYIGPGEYEVRWLLEDHRGRRCTDSWKVKLKPGRDHRQPLEPNTVTPLILSRWNAEDRANRPFKVSILLHAAPYRLRSTSLHPFDQALLISTLAALLEKTSLSEVAVTAFNLNQQRELLRTDRLDLDAFRRLVAAMDELKLGTIGLDVLSKPEGVPQLIDQVVRRELQRPDPPDAIVFIGPNTRYDDSPPADLLREVAGPQPPLFFYLHLARFHLPWKDGIEKLVGKMNGETKDIWRPDDLSDAIRDLEARLKRRAQMPLARKPPSTARIWPVQNFAASDAK
ncbi:MAG: hypothetical protein SFV54_08950 [Bryobacteraceae bacterium]|nr:hypothetical protein [Bryobacteraceae bacterium]